MPDTSQRYVCVHGHFYQPPRENPWIEMVEIQDSAAPYHDWNERITAECYAPNGASRVVDGQNEIIRIVNNYSRISYNYGPTLLWWMDEHAQRTYRMVVDADRASQIRFGGHGSAMAQVYNHIIMPLASTRDKRTQIRWGMEDFEHRFGRRPEGMWLSETAVDLESLDIMAQEGIRFTVLAPNQCARVRGISVTGTVTDALHGWTETPNGSVDTREPYRVNLRDGRSITVFFYDGPASRAVAFEGLLNSGEGFARRLIKGFDDSRNRPQLVHIATDGESYGHHHRHGEMALSYALLWIEEQGHAKITNYGQFLSIFPPEREAEIVDHSSWSCFHGVERWRADCGCGGGREGWNQKWRAPLRQALDELRDSLLPHTVLAAGRVFTDFDHARNAYIRVILDRSDENLHRFFDQYATHPLSEDERVIALKLLELERHAMLMYTSCGWFFDEISGIETVQIIAYAGRALQLAKELFGAVGLKIEAKFIERLAHAKSNVPEVGTGANVYRRDVLARAISLQAFGAHYAISSLFENYPETAPLFCYEVRRRSFDSFHSGRGQIALGTADVHTRITGETGSTAFAVLHLGDQNLSAAVKLHRPEDDAAFTAFTASVEDAVVRANLPEVMRLIDGYFGGIGYSLSSLFRDEQRRILDRILNATVAEVETSLRKLYDDHASLLHYLGGSGMPLPPSLKLAAGFAVNAALRQELEAETLDGGRVRTLLRLGRTDHVEFNTVLLGYIASQRMKRAMDKLRLRLLDTSGMTTDYLRASVDEALELAQLLREFPFEVNLWQAQNIWHEVWVSRFRSGSDGNGTSPLADRYRALGHALLIQAERLRTDDAPD
ncbi:MAG TPA: DUF3536 domain-containing protein [Acidobacteriaceae bacterium]|nr:DUF3536 domain-containing protein [Acidobacteriaceae bacterium]